MQEQVNKNISLLIDDELASPKALSLLNAIQKDPALKDKLQRYQLVSQVLKNESCFLLDNEFAERIHQQIDREPSFFLPRQKSVGVWRKTGWAVAASLVLAVVWMVSQVQKSANQMPEPAVAFSILPQPPSGGMNPDLNDYLQAHDNAVYTQHATRPHPYARVAGYHQE